MLSSLKYIHKDLPLEHYDERKYAVERIKKYLCNVCNEILKAQMNSNSVEKLVNLILKAGRQKKELIIMGSGCDNHLISHASADFLKINHLNVGRMGIPEITAFGNDFAYPYNFAEWISKRSSNESILIGIQLDKTSSLLEEAFFYNRRNNGINILISNSTVINDYIDVLIHLPNSNVFIACDILQLIFHFVSANAAYKTDCNYSDKGAVTLKEYCSLLLQSLESSAYSIDMLADISMLLKEKIRSGRTLFTFGNGGSAAISGYFADSMRAVYKGRLKDTRNIIDITSFNSDIISSLHAGTYNSAFTRIIQRLGVEADDVLVGVSSSGNSENIIHPFTEIPCVHCIGILGFENGGRIGQSNLARIGFVVPDHGGFKSYQRAEDGQRIALSSILSTF